MRTVKRIAGIALLPLLTAACGPQPPADLRTLFIPDTVVAKAGLAVTADLRVQNAGRGPAVLPAPVPLSQGLRVESLKDGGGAAPDAATPLTPAAPPAGGWPTLPAAWPPGHRENVPLPLSTWYPETAKPGHYRATWSLPPFPAAAAEIHVVEPFASIRTNHGEIVIAFHPEEAPKTVLNFARLTRKGFYNGLKFHRIIPGFMMQGGCPKGDGSGGPGYTIPAEFNRRKHAAGTVSMARGDTPDSAGSQFFICFAAAAHLDGKYTAFAEVVRGMDVVKTIEPFGTQPYGRPTEKVVMEQVTLLESLPGNP